MCTHLWRRYYCPRAVKCTQISGQRQQHPFPDEKIEDHHLIRENDNVYRENDQYSFQEVPHGKLIHWVYNVIRCAHLHAADCVKGGCLGSIVQIFKGACYFCTGNVDAYFESPDEVLNTIPSKIDLPGPGIDLSADRIHVFETYREKYLLQLLKLCLAVLSRPYPVEAESRDWEMEMEAAWPEIWCKLFRDHIGSGAFYCECKPMQEEWRTNPAFAMRHNEASCVLDNFGFRVGEEGTVEAFAEADTGQHWDPAEEVWVPASEPTERAMRLEGLYDDDRDFPQHQISFVALSRDTYDRRLYKLLKRAEQCRDHVAERGAQTSQTHPRGEYWNSHNMPWLGLEDWSRSVWRRYNFLSWLYKFLALDAGLDEQVMMYVGGGLLAVLNPWPNPQNIDHSSHPQYLTLNKELAAADILQECVYWVEHHWPIISHSTATTDSFRNSLDVSLDLFSTIDRNTQIALEDIRCRNRTAEARTLAFAVLPSTAIEDGSENCNICISPWDDYPNHEPVMLPCCYHPVTQKPFQNFH
ncbi:hypothetical protein CORC01_01303 [Colletotrichum orchidophilum]|uniref:Uncharacterized protein n=1 Tax=Colletotrichum orchidophilum TaxID=1209926 RepID=A0A1G4BQ74_9PEZI|nr:uncharacterized protein CORC01_01303 [Colletotrichum orchidophilum]OHF03584.1 hypothetical protein CORC01_01303 [Colletotrichum orchidophilum]